MYICFHSFSVGYSCSADIHPQQDKDFQGEESGVQFSSMPETLGEFP